MYPTAISCRPPDNCRQKKPGTYVRRVFCIHLRFLFDLHRAAACAGIRTIGKGYVVYSVAQLINPAVKHAENSPIACLDGEYVIHGRGIPVYGKWRREINLLIFRKDHIGPDREHEGGQPRDVFRYNDHVTIGNRRAVFMLQGVIVIAVGTVRATLAIAVAVKIDARFGNARRAA